MPHNHIIPIKRNHECAHNHARLQAASSGKGESVCNIESQVMAIVKF